jgi:NAD(P)-dependent dehydrogenase (short-subunit alcohol dehydrogenase family)
MGTIQIVTGGTSGMGLETARALGVYGPVLIGGRNPERLKDALENLKGSGVEAYGHVCDISNIESVQEFAKAALEIGPIGNVVNAAGVDFDRSNNEQLVNINMVGTVNVTEVFFPLMTEGTLVNYSSITGYFYKPEQDDLEVWDDATAPDFAEKYLKVIATRPNPMPDRLSDNYVCYTATKKFVMYYTQANTARFGAKGLRILSVAPGSFDTPMIATQKEHFASIAAGTALKRLGDPAEIANLIQAVLDPKLAYLTGVDILIDGGKLALSMAKQIA